MNEPTRKRSRRSGAGGTAPAAAAANQVEGAEPYRAATVHAVHDGEWMEAADLRQRLLEQLREAGEASGARPALAVDLSGIDHLDASVLEVLLAARAHQQRAGATVRMVNASPSLRQWFEYAGAADLLQSPEEGPSCARS